MKKLFSVFLLLAVGIFWAKDGFTINFNIKGNSHNYIYFYYYGGTPSKTYLFDSIDIQNQKNVSIIRDKKIISALYRLQFEKGDNQKYVDIVVDNGAELSFKLKGDDWNNLEAKDDLNAQFLNAKKEMDAKNRELALRNIQQNFPNSVAALYAQLEVITFDIPKSNAQKLSYQKTYFNGVDLNDKRIPLLPNIYSFLYEYVKLSPINVKNYNADVDLLLKGQTCDSPNYIFYLRWIFMNLEYLNRFHLFDSFNYVFSTYLNKNECIVKNKTFYDKTVTQFRNYEKMPIGSVIPDFRMVDKDGKEYYIKQIYPKHQYTFIMLYDPDCSHCKKVVPEVNEFMDNIKRSNPKVDIYDIAFLNAESDYKWLNFVEENHLDNWFNVKSNDPKYQYVIDLNVFANPNFFLLNQKGEILLKTYDKNLILEIIAKQ